MARRQIRDLIGRSICIALLIMFVYVVSESRLHGAVDVGALQLTATLDRTHLSEGETITMVGVVRNVSGQALAIRRHPRPYDTEYVSVERDDGSVLATYLTTVFGVLGPTQMQVQVLQPGDEHTIRVSGTLRHMTIPDIKKGGGASVGGLFLDFKYSHVHVPAPGEYLVRFVYEEPRTLHDELLQSQGIANFWTGRLVSEPVTILIK